MNQAEHDMLVLEAQDGSTRALERLVRHHDRNLLRFAWSLCGDRPTAQDAVQDAWMRISRRLRRLEDPRAFRGWLYHAVRWRVMDLLRQPHRRGEPLDDDGPHADRSSDPGRRDRDMDLARAIDGLPAIERETLQLFYVSGLRIAEIAVVLDIAPGTVKSRLARARDRLKQSLQGEDDEH